MTTDKLILSLSRSLGRFLRSRCGAVPLVDTLEMNTRPTKDAGGYVRDNRTRGAKGYTN